MKRPMPSSSAIRLLVLAALFVALLIFAVARSYSNSQRKLVDHEGQSSGGDDSSAKKSSAVVVKQQQQQQLLDCEKATAFDFHVRGFSGEDVEMRTILMGKVAIIVNVASHCGYTSSGYAALRYLLEHVGNDERLSLLLFPCNSFGQQEPDDLSTIRDFAQKNGVPVGGDRVRLFDKISLHPTKEDHQAPLFRYLTRCSNSRAVDWNWHFFLVVNGHTLRHWRPGTLGSVMLEEVSKHLV